MAITFFATRTLARNAAKELNNGKVKDLGKDAGEKRWAVEFDDLQIIEDARGEGQTPAFVSPDMVEHKREVLKAPQATAEPKAREFVLKDRKNNPVLIHVRRSKTAAKLAAHMARTA